MSKLILLKHAMPAIEPEKPARTWRLSEAGRQNCAPLAKRLAVYNPDIIISSVEPKTVATGEIVASRLNIPFETRPNLYEHDRLNAPFTNQADFSSSVAAFFSQPDELVFGNETADQAHARFHKAVFNCLKSYPGQNIVISTHGTVMTLFISRLCKLEPFPFWKRLNLPSFAILSLPEFELLEVIEKVW